MYYFPRSREIVFSERKKVHLSGILLKGNKFRAIKAEYPAMLVRRLNKELENSICRLGRHSMLVKESINP